MPSVQAAPRIKRIADATDSAVVLYDGASASEPHAALDQDSALRRMLAAGDVLAVFLAFAGSFVLAGRSLDPWTLAAAFAVVPVNKLLGLYDRDAHVLNKTTIEDVPRLLNSAVIMAFIAAGANDLAHPGSGSLSTRVLVVFVLSTATLLALFRMGSRWLARTTADAERCLVIGNEAECEQLRRKMSLSPTVKAEIVGRASLAACSVGSRGIRETISLNGVNRLIVVPHHHDPDEVSEAIRAIRSFGVKISVVPPLMEAIGTSVERDQFCGTELIGVKDMRLTHSSRLLKRALDMTAAALGLLVLSPLLALAAIAIKVDSPGPVFYRQRRIGRDGAGFSMTKFRTMVNGADRQQEALSSSNESVGFFKMQNDPRITRAGRFLRKTSLDELPQLFNVLRGDMSLVGPRPLVPDEDENISGWYRRRSQITPGMTGVWQLHGPVRIPLQEMVKIDYVYVASWSIWSDLKILLQTVPHVFGRRGL
jgi:exopolysaccharide biosynthesis polyprenyl glycosylphosphotransferase